MPKPYLHLHVHLVWSTWDRAPALVPNLRAPVHAAIAAHARKLGCHRVDVGGVADHVHVLVSLPATVSVADLVGQLKGVSSHLINAVLAPTLGFRWQGSYGAFTVGQTEYVAVRDYVNNQPAHHGEASINADWEICAVSQPHDDGAS